MDARSSEIESQGKLHPPWISRGECLAEERTEVGVRSRNSEVGMIERVECFPAKLNGFAFPHDEPPMQRDIDNLVPRRRDDVAARVAEGEWRGSRRTLRC